MTRRQRTSEPEEFSVTVEGKTYIGSYYVEPGVVTVTYGYKRSSTHTDGPAEALARLLLMEMVEAEDL